MALHIHKYSWEFKKCTDPCGSQDIGWKREIQRKYSWVSGRHFSVRRLLDDRELTKLKYSYEPVKTTILAISYEISEVRTFHQMDALPSRSLVLTFHGKWMEELEKKTRSCLLIRLGRGIRFFPEVRAVLCGIERLRCIPMTWELLSRRRNTCIAEFFFFAT